MHIDQNLSWTTHVNQLHNKLMTSKLLLSTNRNLLNMRCLRSIYFAHVYSHLTYGLITWGSMSQKKAIKDLARIQDHCVRLVCHVSMSQKVEPLYRKLYTLRLLELIDLELVKYGYKITNRLYPGKIHSVAEMNGGLKGHKYNTRFKNTPNIQKHGTSEFNTSFLCRGVSIFNALPNKIQNSRNLKEFTKGVKQYLLSTYQQP